MGQIKNIKLHIVTDIKLFRSVCDMSKRVYAVTGANKGLGKAIVKLLLQNQTDSIVYLTSRDTERGEIAVKELELAGLHAQYHQLDITDTNSIEIFRDYLLAKHGGLDVLVNNAGIAYKVASAVPFSEQARGTVGNDFFGTLSVNRMLSPILRNNARVVNVSAQTVERVYPKLSDDLKRKFCGSSLEELQELMQKFVTDAVSPESLKEHGWPQHAYGMAKIGINFMTMLHQKDWEMSYPDRNIVVNCCCPGTVDTDMTGGKYPHAIPADVAADTPSIRRRAQPQPPSCRRRRDDIRNIRQHRGGQHRGVRKGRIRIRRRARPQPPSCRRPQGGNIQPHRDGQRGRRYAQQCRGTQQPWADRVRSQREVSVLTE